MARRKTKEEIGTQTMRMLVANNRNASMGGVNRQGRIMRASARVLPIYQREGNKAGANAMRSRLGLSVG